MSFAKGCFLSALVLFGAAVAGVFGDWALIAGSLLFVCAATVGAMSLDQPTAVEGLIPNPADIAGMF